MLNLVDSHVHLDADAFANDHDAVIARAHAAGINAMIVPATDATSWPKIAALCAQYGPLHPAYGLHPLFLANHEQDHVEQLRLWLEEHRRHAVAVGEIGLDFYAADPSPALQRDYFLAQLKIAWEQDLPVIVHARRAFEEVVQILRKFPGLHGVVHSFSGSQQQAEQLWHLGFHLGIGGPVTYERAQRLRRIVARMPIEFLLLETDAPDQPGAAHRAQRNEPANLAEVLTCIAQLRHESKSVIASATSNNANRLFKLDSLSP